MAKSRPDMGGDVGAHQSPDPLGLGWRARGSLLFLGLCWLFPFLAGPLANLWGLPGLVAGYSNAARSVLLLLALGAVAAVGIGSLRRLPSASLAILAGGALCGVLSCIFSVDPFQSVLFFQQFLAAGLIYLVSAWISKSEAIRSWTSAHSTVSWLLGVHLPALLMTLWALLPLLASEAPERATGGLLLPAGLATWCLLLFGFALAAALSEDPGEQKYGIPSSSLLLAALILSGSRGAWLLSVFVLAYAFRFLRVCSTARETAAWVAYHAGVIGLLLAVRTSLSLGQLGLFLALLIGLPCGFELWRAKGGSRRLGALLLVIGLATLWTVGIETLRPSPGIFSAAEARLSSLQEADESALARLHFWRASLAMLRDDPLTGAGPGRFGDVYPQYQTKVIFVSDSTHALFLELASDFGAVMVTLLLAFVWENRRRLLAAHRRGGPVAQGAFVGLLFSLTYSQIEVGYHFAFLWVAWACAAGLLFLTEEPLPKAAQERSDPMLAWALFALGMGLLLRLTGYELTLERARVSDSPEAAFASASGVSVALPFWQRANTTALRAGMEAQAEASALDPIVDRALDRAAAPTELYFLAGEFAYREGRWERAEEYYRRALIQDRHNYPSVYHSLLLLAEKRGDSERYEALQEEIFSRFSIEDTLRAHSSQRENLKSQIVPMYLDIADRLNPYENPVEAEKLYREILKAEGSARVLHGLGIALWTQGRYREGFPYLEEASRLHPIFPAPPPIPDDL